MVSPYKHIRCCTAIAKPLTHPLYAVMSTQDNWRGAGAEKVRISLTL